MPAKSANNSGNPAPTVRKIDPQQIKDWRVIYPVYLDAKKTVAEGRKMPKDQCIADCNMFEILTMIRKLGFEGVLESKCYPRDSITRGRIKYNVKNPDGSFKHATVHSRKDFYRFCLENIPLLTPEERKKCAEDSKKVFEIKMVKRPMMPQQKKPKMKTMHRR